MYQSVLISFFTLTIAYCGYVLVLAWVCIARDDTLTAVNKFGRNFLALLLPMIGPALAIRSTAETAPDALPEAFRQAVWLRDVEEFSYAEIAEMLTIPVGTVMSRISRGRQALYARLRKTPETDD